MRTNRKKTIRTALLMLLLLIGIGYAALKTTLKIDGTVGVDKTTWDVHFENVEPTTGSVVANPAPTTNNIDTTEMTYTIGFTKPGDFYEFTVDIVNNGTIDAMIEDVSNNAYANAQSTTPIALPSYLESTITYSDGTPIKQNQILPKKNGDTKTVEKVKIRIEFKKDINVSDLPSDGDTTIVFKFVGKFKQADDNAKPIRFAANFETDDWSDIAVAYNSGLTSNLETAYENGTTREIQLDMDNDGTPETTAHLRIANMSKPSSCSEAGFSRSACGLVLEFTDIISGHIMNPNSGSGVIGDGNYGGYEHSSMRNYLNSTVYNALPPELKSRVIDTPVASGHGIGEPDNYYTIDKLYLLSPVEVWGSNPDGYDSAGSLTRQLDYYYDTGVTLNNRSGAIKKSGGANSHWWLRSPFSNTTEYFFIVNYNGNWGQATSSSGHGVSPAFRIG